MGKKIPDISHHHPVKDWNLVKNNVEFLISKATQGTSFTDSTLDSFIKNCESQGIPYWLYTFLVKGDGAKQAEYLVNKCKGKVSKYFIGYIIDAEKNPATKTKPTDAQVKAALDYLSKQGCKYGLYTGYADFSYYKNSITKAKNATKGFWWEARYGKNNGTYQAKYPPNKGASLHQFTSLGTCEGISGKIDLNRITGEGKNLEWFKTPASGEVPKTEKVTKVTEKSITICGHGSGRPSTKVMKTYMEARYKGKAPNGKHRGAVRVMRLKAMTDAKRKEFHDTYKTILGRNYYSQPRRSYVYKKYLNGRYYSDCSSSGMATLKEIGYKVTLLNTAGIYKSSLFDEVPVNIKNGHITNPEVLEVADAILFVGNDPERPLQIGHVEWVYEIESENIEQPSKQKYGGTFPALPPRGYYKIGDGYKTLTNYTTQIKRVQMFLNWVIDAGLTVDGDYGPQTAAAVDMFQKKYGLTADKKFGKKTLAKAKTVKK